MRRNHIPRDSHSYFIHPSAPEDNDKIGADAKSSEVEESHSALRKEAGTTASLLAAEAINGSSSGFMPTASTQQFMMIPYKRLRAPRVSR